MRGDNIPPVTFNEKKNILKQKLTETGSKLSSLSLLSSRTMEIRDGKIRPPIPYLGQCGGVFPADSRPLPSCLLRNNYREQRDSLFPQKQTSTSPFHLRTRGAPPDSLTRPRCPCRTPSRRGSRTCQRLSFWPHPAQELTSRVWAVPFCHRNREGKDTN